MFSAHRWHQYTPQAVTLASDICHQKCHIAAEAHSIEIGWQETPKLHIDKPQAFGVMTYDNKCCLSSQSKGGKMTGKDLATVGQNGRITLAGREEALIQIVLDSVDSMHTKRAYRRAPRDFLGWCAQVGVNGLNKANV
jgi:hypothetical protein